MAAKPESKLQKEMVDAIKARGGWAAKTHGNRFVSGLPDLVGCYYGFFIALEVKTPQNPDGATKLQAAVLRKIRRAGGFAYVVREVEQVNRILTHINNIRHDVSSDRAES